MTRIADTSVLYALFDEDDKHHKNAVDAIEDPDPILIPREILVETVDLIGLRENADHARYILDILTSLPHTRIADPTPFEGVQETHRRNKKLSLADATVVQTCRVHGAKPLSFDKEIERSVAR